MIKTKKQRLALKTIKDPSPNYTLSKDIICLRKNITIMVRNNINYWCTEMYR
jgi:hypothetical protein